MSAEQNSKRIYEFGPFRLDPEKELLLRDDEAIPIAPKAIQVLLVLVRRKKEVVTKDELLKAVWPDTFVEENNLSRNIFLLRKALGESPQDHQYIVTVPGRGYRFAEDVQFVSGGDLNIVAASHSTMQVQVAETRPWGWTAAATALLLAAVLFSIRYFTHRPPALSERDSVVLADFENATGDPVFDGTLRQGLAIQLEQSPFLSILDDTQLQHDLRLMDVQPGARITNAIAHDICVREGAAATIGGAIASLGKSYVISLQSTRCQDGATLAREQVQAPDKEHVLRALDGASTALRRKLGESRSSIQQLHQPLEQATTASLEALQDYTEGMDIMGQGHFLASTPLFERAIQIDPKFTMAYHLLAVEYEQAGETERSAQYAKQAFDMKDRVSEFERVAIIAYFYRFTGEWDKELAAYQLASREYPRYWAFHNQLAVTYIDLGQFEKGWSDGMEASRMEPGLEAPYRRILDADICLDHLHEAEQVAAKVRALGIDGSRIHQRFLEMGYVNDDHAAIAREVRWFAGKPEEYLSFGLQAADLNVRGERRESHKLYFRAADTARHLGFPLVADEFEEADARADALSGKCQTAHRLGRPALALAICGETVAAEKLAAQTSRTLPNGTIWNAVQLPEIQAALALHGNDPARAIDLMAPAAYYERAYPDAIYVRGLAYLKMHKGAEAAAEFQKIVDHKGANWAATWIHPNWGQYYSLSFLGMARGFALAGDRTRARKSFEDFFAAWKDADPDSPLLKEARAEYKSLT